MSQIEKEFRESRESAVKTMCSLIPTHCEQLKTSEVNQVFHALMSVESMIDRFIADR